MVSSIALLSTQIATETQETTMANTEMHPILAKAVQDALDSTRLERLDALQKRAHYLLRSAADRNVVDELAALLVSTLSTLTENSPEEREIAMEIGRTADDILSYVEEWARVPEMAA
jgi:Mg2+ and Co2+ transporter CorA